MISGGEMEERPHFFISYAGPDLAWAEKIAGHLEILGYRTVYSPRDFPPGSSIGRGIDRALKLSLRTIALLSPTYLDENRSDYTSAEWRTVWSRDRKEKTSTLWPIRIKACNPEGLLGDLVFTDLSGCDESAITRKLTEDSARVLGASNPVDGPQDRLPPFKRLPPRSAPPPGSRMLLSASPHFLGRNRELLVLAQHLAAGDVTDQGRVPTAVLAAGPGIGKTQLACEFVYRFGRFFPAGALWINCADPQRIPQELTACGREMNLGSTSEVIVDDVKRQWQAPNPRLLIFDNCEDPDLLEELRPQYGGCRVLATSRRTAWDSTQDVKVLKLRELTPKDAVNLLRAYRKFGRKEDVYLRNIASRVGHHPLALHLAGSFMAYYSQTPQRYLEQLNSRGLLFHDSMHGSRAQMSPTKHNNNVVHLLQECINKLSTQDPLDLLALQLLTRVTVLAEGVPIPNDLLTLIASDLESAEEKPIAFDAVRRLDQIGLVQQLDGSIILHQLVALMIRESIHQTERDAQSSVERLITKQLNEWAQTASAPPSNWTGHLQTVVDRALERSDSKVFDLCLAYGMAVLESESPPGALVYLEHCLRLLQETSDGEQLLKKAQILSALGDLHLRIGNPEGALPLHREAFELRRENLGTLVHLGMAQSFNNLGRTMAKLNDSYAAIKYYESALDIHRRVPTRNFRAEGEVLNNLGVLYRQLNNLAAAQHYHEKALQVRETRLIKDHPDIAQSLLNLGAVFLLSGDIDQARAHLEKALAIRTDLYGLKHPQTARAQLWAGHLRQKENKPDGARDLFRSAFESLERSLGPRAEETLRARQYYEAASLPSGA